MTTSLMTMNCENQSDDYNDIAKTNKSNADDETVRNIQANEITIL